MINQTYKQEKKPTEGPDWSLIPYPPPPVIQSKRLLLRPLHINDASVITQHLNNPKILAVMSNRLPNPYKVEDAIWFINHCNEPKPMQTHFLMVPIDNPSGGPIGTISLEPQPDVYVRTAELGYVGFHSGCSASE